MSQNRLNTVQHLKSCWQSPFVSEDDSYYGDGDGDGEGPEVENEGHDNDEEEHRQLLDDLEGQGNRQPLQSLLKGHSELNLEGKLLSVSPYRGHDGRYSNIFIGTLANAAGCRVAIKKLRASIADDLKFQERLAKELYVWSKLNHPRISRLEGFYIGDGGHPHLVTKWMENGTALKYLEEHPEADLLSLLTGIAEGVKYLHKNEIIHSDIKPVSVFLYTEWPLDTEVVVHWKKDNVLISDSKKPLLCDIGMSRILEATKSFSVFRTETDVLSGSVRYMAKELFELTDERPIAYSKESDVWAFGMTVFTLLTKRRPYESMAHDHQVMTAIIDGILPSWPDDCQSWPITNRRIQSICESCWKAKSGRPSMDALTLNLYHSSPLDEKSPEIADRLQKARRVSDTALIVANLKSRVSDWRGLDISNAGQVILEDAITAMKSGIERELHAYLLETSILMFATKESGIVKGTRDKTNWIPFTSKNKLTSPSRVSEDPDSSEQTSCLLDFKGCILITHIARTRRHALPGEVFTHETLRIHNTSNRLYGPLDAPYLLQVWLLGNDEHEFFSIKCRSQEQMEMWEGAIEWAQMKRAKLRVRGVQQGRTGSCEVM